MAEGFRFGSMRETWQIRAMLLGIGVVLVGAAYLVLLPDLPPRRRDSVAEVIPLCILGGFLVGTIGLLAERRFPRLFARFTPATLAVPLLGLLGILMAISTSALILLGVGMAGSLLLVATPWVRFTTPTKDSASRGSHQDEA